jgi:hypothetical protein
MEKNYLKLKNNAIIIFMKASNMSKLEMGQLIKKDSMIMPDVGPWAIRKHEKIGYYCSLFATSLKKNGIVESIWISLQAVENASFGIKVKLFQALHYLL